MAVIVRAMPVLNEPTESADTGGSAGSHDGGAISLAGGHSGGDDEEESENIVVPDPPVISGESVVSRADRLKAEALSIEHLLNHDCKNP